MFEPEEATQERLLGDGKCLHVRGTLTAAENSAQRNHQQFMKVVQAGISGTRVLQPFKAGDKLIQHVLRRVTACRT